MGVGFLICGAWLGNIEHLKYNKRKLIQYINAIVVVVVVVIIVYSKYLIHESLINKNQYT